VDFGAVHHRKPAILSLKRKKQIRPAEEHGLGTVHPVHGTVAARKSGSHATLCWREMDSNHRSPATVSLVRSVWMVSSSAAFPCL